MSLVLCLAALPAPRADEEEKNPIEVRAAAVARAHENGDTQTLLAIGRSYEEDPWRITDLLLAQGKIEAAIALADRTTRRDCPTLRDFVRSRRGKFIDPKARALLAEVNALHAEGKLSEIPALPFEREVKDDPVAAARLATGLAWAYASLRDLEKAVPAFERAAKLCDALGWYWKASNNYLNAGWRAYRIRQVSIGYRSEKRRFEIESQFGTPFGIAHSGMNLGAYARLSARYQEAEDVLVQAIKAAALVGAEARSILGNAHGNLGRVLIDTYRFQEGVPHLEKELEIHMSLKRWADAARASAWLGIQFKQRGDLIRARHYLERALALRRKGGAPLALILQDRRGIANLDRSAGNYAQAQSELDSILAESRTANLWHGEASALMNLGSLARARGDLRRAVLRLQESLVIWDARGATKGGANARLNLGNALQASGAFEQADAAYRTAASIYEQANNLGGLSSVYLGMSNIYSNRGLPSVQLKYGRLALEAARRSKGADSQARAHSSLARSYSAAGLYADAIRHGEQSLALRKRLADPIQYARGLVQHGSLYRQLGDWDEAERFYNVAEKRYAKLDAPAGLAALRTEKGYIFLETARHEQALRAFTAVRATWTQLGQRPAAATSESARGQALAALNRTEKALSAFRAAEREAEELGLGGQLADIRGSMAELLVKEGRLDEAGVLLESALEFSQAHGRPETEAWAQSLHASIALKRAQPREALARSRAAADIAESIVRGQGEKQAATVRMRFAQIYDVGIRAALAANEMEAVHEFIERGRAGALLEGMRIGETLREAALSPELRRADEAARQKIALAADDYRRALSEHQGRTAVRDARVHFQAARSELKRVIERMQREAKRLAGVLHPRIATLDETRKRLAKNHAFVSYVWGEERVHALLIHGEEQEFTDLGSRQTVAAAIEDLQMDDPEVDPTQAVVALRQLLLDPLGLPPTVRQVVVAADGPIHGVAFAALSPSLIFVSTPSATVYGHLLERPPHASREIFALGAPVYGEPREGRLAVRRSAGLRLTPLPSTRAEAKAIGSTVLLGKEANEIAALKAIAARDAWHAVHFACHGIVNDIDPMLSSLALSVVEGSDGFLTAAEVMLARIPANLVGLSACETATGRVVSGEGLLGLTRAFLYSGTPRVLCSLWKVDDQATSALMRKFYELWHPKTGRGLPAAEALREAQAHVAADPRWEHPYYWAAWVIFGRS